MRPPQLLLPALTGLTIFTASASAWGMLGHRTVALLASRYLLPETALWVKGLLPGTQTILTASTWPDYYAHTPDGRYSAPWHYIDSKDNPPHTCKVNYERDCHGEEGCIVSAIINMTARVVDDDVEFNERSMALKFIVHFLGDIHQPLHTEDLLRGGNQIPVMWGKQHTNLHHVWDSSIAEKHQGGSAVRHAVAWTDSLCSEIEDGKFTAERESWSTCVDPARAEECALLWATESNRWMCDYVLPPDYPVGFEGQDLSGEYFQGAVPIVEELVAKAGWRLAGYLNMIVTGQTGLDDTQGRGASGSEQKVLEMVEDDTRSAAVVIGLKKAFRNVSGWWGKVKLPRR